MAEIWMNRRAVITSDQAYREAEAKRWLDRLVDALSDELIVTAKIEDHCDVKGRPVVTVTVVADEMKEDAFHTIVFDAVETSLASGQSCSVVFSYEWIVWQD